MKTKKMGDWTEIVVTINGSPKNIWHLYGLTANPFPQLPSAEMTSANRLLQDLDSEPIPDVAALRRILEGRCDQEFINLCVEQFKPGRRVAFRVSWPV